MLLTVFVVFVAVVGGVGYHYYREYINPPDFSGAGTASTVVVQIMPGQSASAVGSTLAGKGVVASARAFSNAAKASPQGNTLEPGYYKVHLHMKASLALAMLLRPSARVQSKVTIPEGFRALADHRSAGQADRGPQGVPAGHRASRHSRPARVRGRQARGVPVPGHLHHPADTPRRPPCSG